MKLHDDDGANILLVIFLMLLVIPQIIFSGYVISMMWDWFVVPVFDLSTLTIPQALGLSALTSYMTGRTHDHAKRSEDDAMENLKYTLSLFFRPVVILAVSWVITWFM